MNILTVKQVFLWQLIFAILLSFHSNQIDASQKGIALFAGTAAVLGVCK